MIGRAGARIENREVIFMAKTKKTKPLPRCEAYVHVGDKLVNVDDLNAEKKGLLFI